jgi:uncharacterized protein
VPLAATAADHRPRPGYGSEARSWLGPTIDVVTASGADAEDDGPTVGMLRARRGQILTVAAAHGASNIRVFGSVARGTSTAASDVDLLVDFEAGRSLLDQARLRRDLQQLLNRPVDVVSARGLTDRDDDIRSDALPL